MRLLDAAAVAAALPWAPLIDRLERAFADGAEVPLRHHHAVAVPGGADATLLLMPAWRPAARLGVKIVTVFPDNGARALPAVFGTYLLLSARTGQPEAVLDGSALTLRRTAAASALAARFLARPDARRLLVVGTGALAPNLVRAHSTVRPINRVRIWGRDPAKAAALAADLTREGFACDPAPDLESAVRAADVVSCATLAREPLIQGAWLSPGAHLDLVGGFTPAMREADDRAVIRATVFVDTRGGAMVEAGDIVQPLANGSLTADRIAADLHDLARGVHAGRRDADEITFFKSVGTALEDLAAAELALESTRD